ncbi:MAG TPA: YitT family protein [Ruminococcaceae bacterium]|nr:YitT family protein [Oscillospiraceae bacterium]
MNADPKKFFQRIPEQKALFKDILFFTVGTFLYSVGISVFTAPNRIAPGGATGVATILHYLIHTPIGTMIFVVNIPLLILALRFLGKNFVIKTLYCTVLVSVFTDILALPFVPVYKDNPILASLYGGVLSGAGLALVFLRGGTSGGSDVLSRLFRLKWPYIPMGRMMLAIDCVVVGISAVVFWNVNVALYAIIVEFTSSRVIDSILYGADNGRMALIISAKPPEIAQAIQTELHRGVTLLHGQGYYTGRDRTVILCAVRRTQVAKLRRLVRTVDPGAFMISCNADEVLGEGFKSLEKCDQ